MASINSVGHAVFGAERHEKIDMMKRSQDDDMALQSTFAVNILLIMVVAYVSSMMLSKEMIILLRKWKLSSSLGSTRARLRRLLSSVVTMRDTRAPEATIFFESHRYIKETTNELQPELPQV